MPIIIEAIYIVAPVYAIERRLIGGVQAFRELCPNRSFITDGEVAGIGFMKIDDAHAFAFRLGKIGFTLNLGDPEYELVLVDMKAGLLFESNWCVFERVDYASEPKLNLATVRLKDGQSKLIKSFSGWDPHECLTLQYQQNDLPNIDDLEFVERVNGVDRYRHKVTGKLYYAGRVTSEKPLPEIRKNPNA